MSGSQQTYEFVLSVMGEEVRDIHYYAIIRNPIIKQASFSILRVMLPTVLMKNLINYISSNIFPLVSIKIYGNDSADFNKDSRRQKLYYSTNLECINIKQITTSTAKEQKVPVMMTLTNPIFRFLENNHTFNQILKNQTAYDALKAYENFLKAKYGDIFYFKHINGNINKNTFKYEHMLARASNDINIPSYLIQTYKTHHSYCYYFFDDFYLAEDTSKHITCHFFNMFDKNGLKQVDASKYSDAYHGTKLVSEQSFNDRMNVMDKNQQVNVWASKELNYNHKKLTSFKNLKIAPKTGEPIKVENERTIKNLESGGVSTGTLSFGGAFSKSYIPDDVEHADLRLQTSKKFIINVIEKTSVFEMTFCSPDYPQFGNIYNLDSNLKSEYLYTPISICNMFNRKNEREEFLYHSAKSLMLKYTPKPK